jgi:hypothetical protein
MAGEEGGVGCRGGHLFVVLEELHDGIHGKRASEAASVVAASPRLAAVSWSA